MCLSKTDIKNAMTAEQIIIDPLFPDALQPASVDLHLGRKFLVFQQNNEPCVDPAKPINDLMREVVISDDHPHFMLFPKQFALGVMYERTGVDLGHKGVLDGISSLGRLGTGIHVTASTLNPGKSLRMTLELYNFLDRPVKLYHKMPVAQMSFFKLTTPLREEDGYKGFYIDNDAPVASEYHKNFLPPKNSWMKFE